LNYVYALFYYVYKEYYTDSHGIADYKGSKK
jgi:hypothetical protein